MDTLLRQRLGSLLTLVACFTPQLVFAAVPNAWQITDNSTASGSTLNYTRILPDDLQFAATNNGFRYSVSARYITNFAGANSLTMIYAVDTRRFLVFFNLNGNNDLTAQLEGGPTFTLTTNGTGSGRYHLHEFVFNPATQTASYVVDNVVKTNGWAPVASANPAGMVHFGAGISGGKGQVNFNRAIFSITNTVFVWYEAGMADNPSVAPNPTTQGWTFNQGTAGLTSATDISPDIAVLPVAITLAADAFTPDSARLNGQVKPSGSPTVAWFEWGTTTNYGNATPAQEVGEGLSFSNPGAVVGGLVTGQEYHFRSVASNEYAVVFGTNHFFKQSGFLLIPIPGLPGVAFSTVAWGDEDTDGDLDFLITGFNGNGISQLWRNTGNGFTNAASAVSSLPAVNSGSVAWGDYNRDGRLDFLLTGTTNAEASGRVSQFRHALNPGDGFVNVTQIVAPGLPAVVNGSVAWGDYNNDGRLDFLLTGSSSTGQVSQLWQAFDNRFTNMTASVAPGLSGVDNSSVTWADYDSDGHLDFLLTGTTNGTSSGRISQLWRNTGSGFNNVTASVVPGLAGAFGCSVAWGDYDNDGRLDFLFAGTIGATEDASVSQLWRNTGNGFTNVTASVAPGLPGVYFGSVAWADFDNDGRLDFLLAGTTNGQVANSVSQLWRNTGGGFSNVTATVAPDLPGVYFGTAAWGDYDNDSRLDFLLTGQGADFNYVSQLWRNNLPAVNSPPTAPTGLAVTTSGQDALLSWNAATDAQTPASGLTYNVRAGNMPGGANLISAHVNTTTGFRRLPALGNSQQRFFLPLTGLTNGEPLYWSVQAVDTSFAGGPFATETSVVVSIPQLRITPVSGTNALVSWVPLTLGWRLQETTNLATGLWINSPSGELNPVTVPAANGAKFYRLVNP